MKIAIASGKGGTGKTTFATNLAYVLAEAGRRVQYVDCDVEEPNGHIFLRPEILRTTPATVATPEVDAAKCTGCNACGRICQYSAIVALKGAALTFEQLCHSCGGCVRVCPVGAITEKPKVIGHVEEGIARGVTFLQGRLEIGDVRSPALIKQVKARIEAGVATIVDAPPGTTCPVVETVRDADFVVLVTEPTPFGLHDLKLAVAMVRHLGKTFSVVINRSGAGDDGVKRFCRDEGITITMELADDRRIAEAYSSGRMAAEALPEYRRCFEEAARALGIL
ncbi:MAG TPA: ATP-binding protein [Anaerohalosphaeraceae bacterium]|jgi:MinD superfamily P-loop ATPase|nr:ATP-binding protein [Anaerohalosphaeraceae bacterium]HRT52178.1 ATP-binding protein [Anaerohalosphaeraceae bacterium]HRT88204.1 ATP-binding protein [Anaerohalosphaeraceae bacterium]